MRAPRTLLVSAVLAASLGCRCGAAPRPRPVARPVSDRPALLATVPAEAAPPAAPAPRLAGLHVSAAPPGPEFIFAAAGGGVAWVREEAGRFRVIHGDAAGPPYQAVGRPALSPDGRRLAYGAYAEGAWRMVVDGVAGEPVDTVEAPRFSPDGAHVAWLSLSEGRWHLVVDGVAGPGTTGRITGFGFTADSAHLAAIVDAGEDDAGRLVLSGLSPRDATTLAERASGLVIAEAGPGLAAVVSEPDGQRVLRVDPGRPAEARRGERFDAIGGLVVSADGGSAAWLAERAGQPLVVRDEATSPLPAQEAVVGPLVIVPGGPGVGLLAWTPRGVEVRRYLGGEAAAGGPWEEAEGLAFDEGGRAWAVVARRGASWMAVVDGREGPPFERAVTPAFSPDGARLVYRAREAGRRFVVVADREGRVVRRSPEVEQVHPVGFTADGRSLAYGAKDGASLRWIVEALP